MKKIFIKEPVILVNGNEIIEVSECTVFTNDETLVIYQNDEQYDFYKSKIVKTTI
jgi:hypothetical protein